MYQPKKYKNNEPEFIFNYIKTYPFATLVMQGEDLLATHVPVLLEGNSKSYRLYAHIANHNPMRESLVENEDMLLIFSGPNAYISSSWYEEPDIPTWDYTAVHINAKIQIQSDNELEISLMNLIQHFENNQPEKLTVEKIPTKIWNDNFKEITGFWLQPYKAVGIEKLHQGFIKKDVINIVDLLKESDCPHRQLGNLIRKKHNL